MSGRVHCGCWPAASEGTIFTTVQVQGHLGRRRVSAVMLSSALGLPIAGAAIRKKKGASFTRFNIR